MEPFRVLVDRRVSSLEIKEFDKNVRLALVDLLHEEIMIRGSTQTLLNSVGIYVRRVFDALNEEDSSQMEFYSI